MTIKQFKRNNRISTVWHYRQRNKNYNNKTLIIPSINMTLEFTLIMHSLQQKAAGAYRMFNNYALNIFSGICLQ